jgi:hypothetical protein
VHNCSQQEFGPVVLLKLIFIITAKAFPMDAGRDLAEPGGAQQAGDLQHSA